MRSIGLSGIAEKRRDGAAARPGRSSAPCSACACSAARTARGRPATGRSDAVDWLRGLRHLHGVAMPASAALTRARGQRLGAEPLELLFDLRRGMLAGEGTPGASAFGLRLVAWDGTGLDTSILPPTRRRRGDLQRRPAAAAAGADRMGQPRGHQCRPSAASDASELELDRQLLHALRPRTCCCWLAGCSGAGSCRRSAAAAALAGRSDKLKNPGDPPCPGPARRIITSGGWKPADGAPGGVSTATPAAGVLTPATRRVVSSGSSSPT